MEKPVNELNEINENEIASMIYEKVNAYWGKFPNIWNYVTKDDMATQAAIDLYKKRKEDGVPHIVHYFKTRGERSLNNLIGVITYNVMKAEARHIHATGIFSNDARRNITKPVSLDKTISDDDSLTLGDTIASTMDISREVDYVMLYDSLPDKTIDGIYYKVNDKYMLVSYKTLLKDIIDGYNLTQIAEKLYKQSKDGYFCEYTNISKVISDMRNDLKSFLEKEYNFTKEDYTSGGMVL